jgi:hypothetical protein
MDLFVTGEKENDLTFLILDGNNVEETIERGA